MTSSPASGGRGGADLGSRPDRAREFPSPHGPQQLGEQEEPGLLSAAVTSTRAPSWGTKRNFLAIRRALRDTIYANRLVSVKIMQPKRFERVPLNGITPGCPVIWATPAAARGGRPCPEIWTIARSLDMGRNAKEPETARNGWHSTGALNWSTQLEAPWRPAGTGGATRWASAPWGIALAPDGKKLYTANGESNDVSVIDTGSLKVIATIPAGAGAWGVAMGRSFSR